MNKAGSRQVFSGIPPVGRRHETGGDIMKPFIGHSIRFLVLLPLLSPAMAQQVYKSVDDRGKVTYSSTPPADAVQVETVPLAPSPSAAEMEAAGESAKKAGRLADELQRERQARQAEADRREQSQATPSAVPGGDQRLESGGYDNGPAVYPRYVDPRLRRAIRERLQQRPSRPSIQPLPPRPRPR